MKVIGYKKADFKANDGKHITGMNIYCTYPLNNGTGEGVERLYLSDEKLDRCGYEPIIGDEINVLYNKYGKPDAIESV